MKEGIAAHIAELKAHTDLGEKPKSVQPIRGEVYSAGEQIRENSIHKHVNELQWQASLKGEPAPLQPVPEERKAAERREMPPPPEEEKPYRVRQSEKDPNRWVIEYPADEGAPFRLQATLTPRDPGQPLPGEEVTTEFAEEMLPSVMRDIYRFLAIARKRANPDADQ